MDSESVPEEWNKGVMVKIPKKGDLQLQWLEGHHDAASLSSKVLARIILYRTKEPIDERLRKEQPGFRQNRSRTDHDNALRIILEQFAKHQLSL